MLKTFKILLVCFLVGLLILLLIFAGFVFLYPQKYSTIVQKYSNEYNIDTNLIYSVIRAESSFDKDAVSRSGAIGLMQLMPTTAVWIAGELNETFELQSLCLPDTNIKYGCFYLRYLLNKFNNETYALCAYNAGETVVRNWINSQEEFTILYPETANYVKKVEKAQKVYTLLNKLSK